MSLSATKRSTKSTASLRTRSTLPRQVQVHDSGCTYTDFKFHKYAIRNSKRRGTERAIEGEWLDPTFENLAREACAFIRSMQLPVAVHTTTRANCTDSELRTRARTSGFD
jgi:hypothetical protein